MYNDVTIFYKTQTKLIVLQMAEARFEKTDKQTKNVRLKIQKGNSKRNRNSYLK